jgi:hypothetical protein
MGPQSTVGGRSRNIVQTPVGRSPGNRGNSWRGPLRTGGRAIERFGSGRLGRHADDAEMIGQGSRIRRGRLARNCSPQWVLARSMPVLGVTRRDDVPRGLPRTYEQERRRGEAVKTDQALIDDLARHLPELGGWGPVAGCPGVPSDARRGCNLMSRVTDPTGGTPASAIVVRSAAMCGPTGSCSCEARGVSCRRAPRRRGRLRGASGARPRIRAGESTARGRPA